MVIAACSRLHIDRQQFDDWASLVAQYPSGEFESPYRSTIPLLSLIRDGQAVLQEVLVACGFAPGPDLHFEYTVHPPIGEGKPSHTDLMVCEGSSCMAVEAKWTEPPYPTVGNWLGPKDGRTTNRKNVLAGWLSLIQPFASTELTEESVEPITYQTIHRAASACATSERPQLAYLQFVSERHGDAVTREKRLADLNRLRSALGRHDGFQIRLIEIDIEPTLAFEQLARLPKGSKQTGEAVRLALNSSSLFAFKPPRLCLLP